MNYDYYKKKYKKITIQLDREKDADIITFIEECRGSFKHIFCSVIRYTMLLLGDEKNENV